ncbi:vWA domain-containing protein [Haloarchaeobius sp. FL176]|uniref:vWA domain-containing protein n=1 Tax=Haloarchaeobius sp. FL176 TaxID=2967129 RepID=UPI002148D8A7|nr:vWA domain-containing protein [Haloarchaeobius sp. FL176]
MSKNIELSRRKILAGIGAAGVASVGAGLGTSAYFSDRELFEGNTIAAGELDLKVDWEEHYSDWSSDENVDIEEADDGESQEDDGEGGFSVTMTEPQNTEGFTAFPPGTQSDFNGQEPLIWVPDPYVDDFMANTAIEAFPDMDNDGLAEFPVDQIEGDPCDFLADVGGESGGDLGSYTTPGTDDLGRTDNDDTVIQTGEGEGPAPLINLHDVKPGDFGEVTFSTHLCNNPGYLWMTMPDGLTTSENGLTEPEMEDGDEDQTVNESGDIVPKQGVEEPTVELADKLQTAIWYDNNCDNLFTCDEKVDVMAVADTSASIEGTLKDDDGDGEIDIGNQEIDLIAEGANTFVSELEARASDPDDVRAGLLTFNGPTESGTDISNIDRGFERPALRAGLGPLDQFDRDGDGSPEIEQFLPAQGVGDTPMPHALDLAQKVLNNDPDGRNDARKVILLVTDGLPDYVGTNSGTTPYTVTDAEGSPLSGSGATYTSESYSGSSDGNSSPGEQEATAIEAEEIQQDGIEVVVAGVGLDVGNDQFLEDEVAGQDGDRTIAEPNYFFDVDFPSQIEPGDSEQPIGEAAEDLAQFLVSGDGECEKTIFQGTLREAAQELTANGGLGIPLTSNQATDFDELEDSPDDPGRECFSPGHTSCFGFSWWLPVNHGNEVQSDSVSFDIGFYTEQCRHNEGEGIELV